MAIVADLAQTFFIDSDSVQGSQYCFIDNIDLFFKSKPASGATSSSLPSPGVTIYIVETKNINNIAVPELSFSYVRYGRVRREYSQVSVSNDALAATNFKFNVPVPIRTNISYAIVIKFDGGDTGFSLWRNKSNETYNAVQSPSITKGALDGFFFILTNGTNPTPQSDQDLKFNLSICRFTTSNTTYNFVNRNYEVLTYKGDTIVSSGEGFIGGEYVFANNGFPAGQTISISTSSKVVTGTNTSFQSNFVNGSLIVLNSGTTNDVRKIVSISNNTVMTLDFEPAFSNSTARFLVTAVGKVFDQTPWSNTVTLIASTSNVSHNFIANSTSNTIHGTLSNTKATVVTTRTFNVDTMEPRFGYFIPPGTSVNTYANFANNSFNTVLEDVKIVMGRSRRFTSFPARLFSTSDEVTSGNGSVGVLTNSKSINFYSTFSSENPYVSPLIDEEDLILNGSSRFLNNDLTNEHTNQGNARAKVVTKRITLADGQDAEDIRVFVTAFRPFGTDVKVYGKFYNETDPDSFNDKNWSLLEVTTPFTLYSNPNNFNDLVELEYKLPAYPLANTTTLSAGTLLDGQFTGTNSNNVLIGTTITVNSFVSNTDLVRIFHPLFPNNSLIAVVTGSNTTSLTIDTTLSTANNRLTEFVRSGLKIEKVQYKNTAFNNYTANNVIRYYNKDMAAFDTYKVFCFKIVLTGTQGSGLYPFVDDIRGIACSI